MISIKRDRDGWWRVTRNGRILPARKSWWNLYRTKAGARAKARAILRDVEGEPHGA